MLDQISGKQHNLIDTNEGRKKTEGGKTRKKACRFD